MYPTIIDTLHIILSVLTYLIFLLSFCQPGFVFVYGMMIGYI